MTIAELLDTCGLPWRVPRQDLIARFGISKHPAYRWDIVAVEGAAPVSGLLYPLYVLHEKNIAPHLPALHFSGATWFGHDARGNFRRTTEDLSRKLGKPQDHSSSNTVGCIWQSGAASITLTVWPKDLDRWGAKTHNPALVRDPRLGEACHIVIETGFKPPLSEAERAMLDTFEPFAELAYGHHFDAQSIASRPAFASDLEFVRDAPADLTRVFRKIGLSADRTTLIFCHTQLFLVPVSEIACVALTRLRPARGPGRACLSVRCSPVAAGQTLKDVTVDEKSGGPTALDVLANLLAKQLGKPLTETEAYDD